MRVPLNQLEVLTVGGQIRLTNIRAERASATLKDYQWIITSLKEM